MDILKGRLAIVTGGAKGIGAGISAKLFALGANVVVWDIGPLSDELRETAKQRHDGADRLHAIEVDISSEKSVAMAERETHGRFGVPNILVNNAGIAGPNHKLHEYPIDEWRRIIDINLVGTFLCCRALVPPMVSEGQGGKIVNIASIAGKEGNPLASGYSASKAGVIALTKSLGKELVGSNILVNCIAPAAIETDILKQSTPEFVDYMISKIPMGRLGRIDEVSELVAWLCSDSCSFSTGATFDISGGRATY